MKVLKALKTSFLLLLTVAVAVPGYGQTTKRKTTTRLSVSDATAVFGQHVTVKAAVTVVTGAPAAIVSLAAMRARGAETPTAPERAVREFIKALAMHDASGFAKAVRPDPRSSRFLNPQPLTPDQQADARRRLETLQVRASEEVMLRGQPVQADANGDYPVGSVGRFLASGDGGPAVVTIVRTKDGWKVDLRWWLAMLDMASAGEPAEGSPEHAIKNLILALLALNRDAASRFLAPGRDIGVLFAGAPPYREPSGVLEATTMEMPLVEVGPGEFYAMPSGRVVEGSADADRKLIVGQFGPVAMPFGLRRVGQAWRVEAEPYFALINR